MFYGQLKIANNQELDQELSLLIRGAGLGSLLLSRALGAIAHSGAKADKPEDRIDPKETKEWGKKYLKSNINVEPIKDLENAYYFKDEKGKHNVHYDPTFNKSIAAHEIGHGMSSFPRVPLAGIIAPIALTLGGVEMGASLGQGLGPDGIGKLLIGAGALTPTLIDEWMASHNAKKILNDHKIQPKGLNRAWLTYTLPAIVGAGAGVGAYHIAKD
jgi:hypothetical protein